MRILSSSTPAVLSMMLKKKASTRSWKWQNIKRPVRCKALIVTGCLAQRYKQEIVDEIPEVDAVLGTSKYDEIVDALDQALRRLAVFWM